MYRARAPARRPNSWQWACWWPFTCCPPVTELYCFKFQRTCLNRFRLLFMFYYSPIWRLDYRVNCMKSVLSSKFEMQVDYFNHDSNVVDRYCRLSLAFPQCHYPWSICVGMHVMSSVCDGHHIRPCSDGAPRRVEWTRWIISPRVAVVGAQSLTRSTPIWCPWYAFHK